MYNASDRKDIRRAEKAEKVTIAARADFIRASMSTSAGRAWFYSLLASCHCFHVMPPTTPLIREFSEGERNVGIQIYNDILTFCPDLYLLMIHEAQTRELSNARSDPDLYSQHLYSDNSGPITPASELGRGSDSGRDPDRPDSAPDDGGWDDNLIGLNDE